MTREKLLGVPMDEKIAYLIRDSLSIADATKEIMHLIDTYAKEYGEKQYDLGFSEVEDFGKHKERKKTRAKVLEARIDEINKMPSFYGSHEDFQSMWESERTATLQAERSKL